MYQTNLWQDITASVHQAIAVRLDLLSEGRLVQRSDALLAKLPGVSRAQSVTTATLLGRYHTHLHKELCCANQPRTGAASIEDDLFELTRAVLVTVGVGEGVSVEAAVGMALVLYRRGIVAFCALPSLRPTTAEQVDALREPVRPNTSKHDTR